MSKASSSMDQSPRDSTIILYCCANVSFTSSAILQRVPQRSYYLLSSGTGNRISVGCGVPHTTLGMSPLTVVVIVLIRLYYYPYVNILSLDLHNSELHSHGARSSLGRRGSLESPAPVPSPSTYQLRMACIRTHDIPCCFLVIVIYSNILG